MPAVRYWDAVISACAFGWWLYPPLDMALLWDGSTIFWQNESLEVWEPVDDAVAFPGLAERLAVTGRAELAPPLLTALPEPGIVQLSLGVIATHGAWLVAAVAATREPPNLRWF
jgi:hypothetical protein